MLRVAVVLLTLLVCTVSPWAQSPAAPSADAAAVRAVLMDQAAAWNKGDLDGYMSGYWNSPELAFIGGARETLGFQPTLERYRKGYQATGREMGQLDFPEMRVMMLGPESAMVTGRFHLKMSSGKEPAGRFTVVLRKFAEGWKIVHDHSCSE